MHSRSLNFGLACIISLGLEESVLAQVHYHDNIRRKRLWRRRAHRRTGGRAGGVSGESRKGNALADTHA